MTEQPVRISFAKSRYLTQVTSESKRCYSIICLVGTILCPVTLKWSIINTLTATEEIWSLPNLHECFKYVGAVQHIQSFWHQLVSPSTKVLTRHSRTVSVRVLGPNAGSTGHLLLLEDPSLYFASPNLNQIPYYIPVSVPKLELSKKFVGRVSGRGFDASWVTVSWERGSLKDGICSLRESDTFFPGDLGTVSLENFSFNFSALSFHFLNSSFNWASLLNRGKKITSI